MEKYIWLIIVIICIVIIVKKIITSMKKEKEIEFNEFDDLERIKQNKLDEKHIENENKALEKIIQEKEYYKMVKKEKTRREKEKQSEIIRNVDNKDNMIDMVGFINENISDTVQLINKKIEDKEKREQTKILENFEPKIENKIYEGSEINEIKESYSNFNLDVFKKWSEGIFICIETGEVEELEIIKKSIIPEMYNRLIKNTNKLMKEGLKLIREEIFIEEIKLIDYGKKINNEEIKIFIRAQMKEYIINTKNEKIVRGSKDKIKEKNIIMTFYKRRIDLEEEGILYNCQNCGAPISQIEFGKCKYCESILLPIRYNWVLTKFEVM